MRGRRPLTTLGWSTSASTALGVNQALDLLVVDAFRLLEGDLAHDDLGALGQAGRLQQALDAQAVAFNLELLELGQHVVAQRLPLEDAFVVGVGTMRGSAQRLRGFDEASCAVPQSGVGSWCSIIFSFNS